MTGHDEFIPKGWTVGHCWTEQRRKNWGNMLCRELADATAPADANALMMRMLSAMVMMFFCDLQRRAKILFENTIREFSALNDDMMVVVVSGAQKMMQSLL